MVTVGDWNEVHIVYIEREYIHTQLTHPTHPTHPHPRMPKQLEQQTTNANKQWTNVTYCRSATSLYTHAHTHILVQWSSPTLRLRQGNDSVPLCFPQNVNVYARGSICTCTFLCVCATQCIFAVSACNSCHFVNVFWVCLCVCACVWMWSGPVIFQAAKRKPTSTAIYHTLGIDLPSAGRNGMARLASPLL